MDKLSISGAVLAIAALVGGSILKGAGLVGLWSPAAFVIVIVGTVAAVLLQTPLPLARRAFAIARWVFQPPTGDRAQMIATMVDWSTIARKSGLLGLESRVDEQQDPFLRKGLQMVVDGVEPEAIRQMLEIEADGRTQGDVAASKVFESAGVYSPTLGIVGAVLGLMAVMKHLSEPDKIGAGIAAAFTATIYGIGMANLVLLPMAGKLKTHIVRRHGDRELIIEGLVGLANGENPRTLETRLNGFVD